MKVNVNKDIKINENIICLPYVVVFMPLIGSLSNHDERDDDDVK